VNRFSLANGGRDAFGQAVARSPRGLALDLPRPSDRLGLASRAHGAARSDVTILAGAASSLDRRFSLTRAARRSSPSCSKSLTAVDSQQRVQPALAAGWESQNAGKRIVFHLLGRG